MGKTSNKVKDTWNSIHYDDIRMRVPSGAKEIIKAHAEAEGMTVNGFIQKAILRQMGMEDWKISVDSTAETGI